MLNSFVQPARFDDSVN